jgi:hypothetical protein
MAADATKTEGQAASLLQHAAQLYELHALGWREDELYLGADRRQRRHPEKHYAKYIAELHPQRTWIETQIRKNVKKAARKGEKFKTGAARSQASKTKKPSTNQGLSYGAGEEGRTPDLMLGKHTL